MARPVVGDYVAYYDKYVSLVQEADFNSAISLSIPGIREFLSHIPSDKADFAYAPGKWTVKQVLQHIIDTERIFAYRALCIARGEQQNLPGYEQDDFASAADVKHRDVAELSEELLSVRQTSIFLFQNFSDKMLNARGKASGNAFSVLSLGYIIVGHWRHHENLFREKYGIA